MYQIKNKVKRLNNLDLLKIICCIAVIIIHISAKYTNIKRFDMYGENEIFFSNLLNCITRFAVPCFIMISGYFAISNSKKDTSIEFYKKKIKTIVIPTIIFSIFYSVVLLGRKILEDSFSIEILGEVLESLILGSPYWHIWYLYMFIFLCAITPLLWKIKDRIGDKKLNKLGIFLLVISIPFALTSKHKFTYDIGYNIYFIGYFILGYTLKIKTKEKSNIKFILYLLIGLVILSINSLFRWYLLNKGITDNSFVVPFIGNLSLVDNFWIPIPIAAILIYKAFLYLDLKIDLSKIAKYSLYIYLLHAFVLDMMVFLLERSELIITPYITTPILTILVFCISMFLSKIYLEIYKKIDKKEWIENGLISLIKKIVN